MADLHRLHAAPSAKGNRVDIGAVAWRGEGGTFQEKRDTAWRIAVCWNVLEGWPTAALEAGALRDVDDAARAMLSAAEALGDQLPGELVRYAARLRAAFARRDPLQDLTHGRPHDCATCLGKDRDDDDGADDGGSRAV